MLSPHSLVLLLSLCVSTLAAGHSHPHTHTSRSIPGTWFHARSHPAHRLFRRAVGADGKQYPDVGSQEWRSKYPPDRATGAGMPAEWATALKEAEGAGKIPKIPTTTFVMKPDGSPDIAYPSGTLGLSAEVCSTYQKCFSGPAVYHGPPGTFATSFDDGPTQFTQPLLDFLKSQNERATHFMIGHNALEFTEPFKILVASGDDLAVHTYNHLPMTNLTNEDVVAQLAWTMQIIHDSTGGLLPKYWRPPYGDSDNRVDAIAREVLGLTTVIWNHDTNDWRLEKEDGAVLPADLADFQANYLTWATGPKDPGLIVLDHERAKPQVDEFAKAFLKIKENGWKTGSLAEVLGQGDSYQNVKGEEVVAITSALKFKGAFKGTDAKTNTTTPGTGGVKGGATNTTSTSTKESPSPSPTGGAFSVRVSHTSSFLAFLGVVALLAA